MLPDRDSTVIVAGVLLAAGAGRRFGGDKLLAPLPDGTAIGIRSARTLRGSVDRAVAVVRPTDLELARRLAAEGLEVVPFPGSEAGMGASLAFGASATREAGAWVVALADMPFVGPETVDEVVRRLRAGVFIAAPVHRDRRGHPVGFCAALRDELIALDGDSGARSLLARHADRVETFECGDPGSLLDIDSLDDLPEALDELEKKNFRRDKKIS